MKFCKTLSIISSLAIAFTTLATFSFGASSEPVVYYNFDDNLKDSSGNSNDGQKSGNILFSKGIQGKAAEFKGGFFEILNSESIDLKKAFSISVWIKLDAELPSSNPILFKPAADDQSSAIAYYGLGYGSTTPSSYLAYGEDYGNNSTDVGSTTSLDASGTVEKWCHLAYAYDGKQQKFYVDGALTDSFPIPDEILEYSSTLNDSAKKILIGKGYGVMYKGLMDEFKLYDYAVSDDDVTELYNSVVLTYKNKIVLQLNNSEMFIDDTKVEIDPGRSTVPVVVESRTLVPVRAVIEAMGGKVEWIASDRKINVTLKSNTISLILDKLTAKVNGTDMKLDVPPQIINERTMLPLRFVSENLGAKVDWNGDTSTITINFTR